MNSSRVVLISAACAGSAATSVRTSSSVTFKAALRLAELPLVPDGPGDHMDSLLARDDEFFVRVPLGGRPMGVRFARDGQRVYVANYLDNSVQIVNVAERKLERSIPLGSADEQSLARRGEAIFVDALRSADGWYSCHSCHYEGG